MNDDKPTDLPYGSLPDVKFGCETVLSIRPPGAWFDNPDYVVFVGGNGVGSRKTLIEAERLLHLEAIAYCRRRQAEAEVIGRHYDGLRRKLGREGVRREPK